MDWIEMIVHTTTAGADAVSFLMMENGAGGTMTEDRADIPDPSKPSGIWEIIDPKLLERMPDELLPYAQFRLRVAKKALSGAEAGGDGEQARALGREMEIWEEVLACLRR